MTPEQQRSLALARARRRRAEATQQAAPQSQQSAAPEQPQQPMPTRGTWLDPFMQGLVPFADEAKGAVRGGARYLLGNNPGKSYGDLYGEEVASTRADLEGFRERHPNISPALEVTGAVASVPFIPGGVAARTASLGERVIGGVKAGSIYGGLYGAGAADGNLTDRAIGGAVGAATGGAMGAAAPVVVRGVQAAGRGIRDTTRRVTGPAGGVLNRDREAAKRIGRAMQIDAGEGVSAADEAVARISGQPIFNLDRGGETVRALARSSANASPAGRSAMENAVSDRFAAQGDRTTDTVRRIVGGKSTTEAREALQRQSRFENSRAYKKAYEEGQRGLWSSELERLASSPAVLDAVKAAIQRGKNRAVSEGFGGFNPSINVDPSGLISFQKGKTGVPTYPDLQFWDYVRRELSDTASAARRTGRNEEAGAVSGLASQMNQELDRLVPSYRDARAGAARFFGADDAVEAGEQFVLSRMANDEARVALGKMSKADRQLFSESFADSLVRRIAEVGDRRNVINSTFLRSSASKERIELALGPQKTKELEAFLRVEDLLDRARSAFGNSTTTRQLVELGIGGSAVGYGSYTGDWKTAGLVLGGLIAKNSMGRIDREVATRIGQMLASKDPNVVKNALALVAHNDRWMSALRLADIPATLGATQAATSQATQALRVHLNAGERDRQIGATP